MSIPSMIVLNSSTGGFPSNMAMYLETNAWSANMQPTVDPEKQRSRICCWSNSVCQKIPSYTQICWSISPFHPISMDSVGLTYFNPSLTHVFRGFSHLWQGAVANDCWAPLGRGSGRRASRNLQRPTHVETMVDIHPYPRRMKYISQLISFTPMIIIVNGG